jgi:hypothetical protein
MEIRQRAARCGHENQDRAGFRHGMRTGLGRVFLMHGAIIMMVVRRFLPVQNRVRQCSAATQGLPGKGQALQAQGDDQKQMNESAQHEGIVASSMHAGGFSKVPPGGGWLFRGQPVE